MREAERVAPRRKARREIAAGDLSGSGWWGLLGEEGVEGEEGEESVGVWVLLASRGWPFEWLVWGSQGLRCVRVEKAWEEEGWAIEGGGGVPGCRLRL